MQKSFIPSLLGLSIICSLLHSCDGNSGKAFSTKQDSLSFAQAVMEKYPGESQAVSLQADTIPKEKSRNFQEAAGGLTPISWETVREYGTAYDKNPKLKSPQGYFYKGFIIDTAGYNTLLRTKTIKGLFLRLGQKPDGSYTIMVLGIDEKGNMVSSSRKAQSDSSSNSETNFDNLPSCPNVCPEPEQL